MTKVWQLMLLWGVVVGIGTGMTALVLAPPSPRAGSRHGAGWWSESLPASVAPAIGVLPLCWPASPNGWVADRVGADVRDARDRGIGVLLVMRDRPGDVGCGRSAMKHRAIAGAPIQHRAIHGGGAGRASDAETRVFWILFATFFTAAPAPTVWSGSI